MVVVGSALMVALNGLSAGAADFISKQLNFLAPNVIFVSPGQIGFRGGPSAPPTIVFNAEVVNRIKSLPFVQDVVPAYQGQLQLDAQGSIINSQVLATDPTKIYLIAPNFNSSKNLMVLLLPFLPDGTVWGRKTFTLQRLKTEHVLCPQSRD